MPYRRKKPLKLVIFDLDGVICDSEALHKFARLYILNGHADTENIDLSWAVGYSLRDTWIRLIHEYQLQQDPEELALMQYDVILDQMQEQNMATSSGLRELLAWIQSKNLKIGMYSSSDRYYVDRVLDRYKLRDTFDYVVAGDEVSQRKPSPEGYLKVLEMAGVSAKNAVAIEDSLAGTQAAAAAGIACIGYQNPTSGNQDLSQATWLVDDLYAVPSFLFERMAIG